jgi:hypothetical protein
MVPTIWKEVHHEPLVQLQTQPPLWNKTLTSLQVNARKSCHLSIWTELQSLHCLLILSIVFMKIDIHVIMCDNSIVIFSPMISLSSKYWFQIQHQPHWVYIFTAMTFTEYSATCLSRNSTSYIQVSRIRLGCSIPLREPSCSLFQGDNRWGVDACRIVHDFQYQHGTTCLFRKMSINGWQTGWNLLSIPSDT